VMISNNLWQFGFFFVFCFLSVSFLNATTTTTTILLTSNNSLSTSIVKSDNFTNPSHDFLDENTLFYLSSFCKKENLLNWNCYWCNKTRDKIRVRHFLNGTAGTFGFIGETSDRIMVVFRGTVLQDLDSWINNMLFPRVSQFPADVNGSSAHYGFLVSIDSIQKNLLDFIAEYPKNKPIRVTGHSRGGALAILAAMILARHGESHRLEVITFGSPRVGNDKFASYFASLVKKSWRVVNQRDIVPHLPPSKWLHFHHVEREIWVQADGTFRLCSPENSEDPTCSAGIPYHDLSILNHITYFGRDHREGKRFGCIS